MSENTASMVVSFFSFFYGKDTVNKNIVNTFRFQERFFKKVHDVFFPSMLESKVKDSYQENRHLERKIALKVTGQVSMGQQELECQGTDPDGVGRFQFYRSFQRFVVHFGFQEA